MFLDLRPTPTNVIPECAATHSGEILLMGSGQDSADDQRTKQLPRWLRIVLGADLVTHAAYPVQPAIIRFNGSFCDVLA